jgi:hypothetical protein
MKILILSCPRSGTKYTSDLLKFLGLDFKHEAIGDNGGIGFPYVIQEAVSVNGKEYEKTDFKDFDFIFHQVRNPLNVVRSLPPDKHPFWEFTERYIGKLSGSKIERHFQFWVKWNKMCEKNAMATYRVESLPVEINNVSFETTTNTRIGKLNYLPRVSWNQVDDSVVELASKYGYG